MTATAGPCSLDTAPIRPVLDRLHAQARGDTLRFVTLVPRLVVGRLQRKSFSEIFTPKAMAECFIPVDRPSGRFLYLAARAIGARQIVEFGTSFGISTVYLAAATRDNGGGRVIGTEIEPSKAERARANVSAARLADQLELRVGDARQTLAQIDAPVDLLFIDGWKAKVENPGRRLPSAPGPESAVSCAHDDDERTRSGSARLATARCRYRG